MVDFISIIRNKYPNIGKLPIIRKLKMSIIGNSYFIQRFLIMAIPFILQTPFGW